MVDGNRYESLIFRRPTLEDHISPHWETEQYLRLRRYKRECGAEQPIWEDDAVKDDSCVRYAAIRFSGGPYVPVAEEWDGEQWRFLWWEAFPTWYRLEARDWAREELRPKGYHVEGPMWKWGRHRNQPFRVCVTRLHDSSFALVVEWMTGNPDDLQEMTVDGSPPLFRTLPEAWAALVALFPGWRPKQGQRNALLGNVLWPYSAPPSGE